MTDLRAVIRIKSMANNAMTATKPDDPWSANGLAETHNRLREEARRLNERAGWSAEDFERELPVMEIPPRMEGHISIQQQMALLRLAGEARIHLGQLAGRAEGHQEAFEIEERLKAKPKRGTGFSA